jgi:hypothetical protein
LLEEAGAVGLPIILPEITDDRAIDHAILVRFRMKIAGGLKNCEAERRVHIDPCDNLVASNGTRGFHPFSSKQIASMTLGRFQKSLG